MVGLVGPVDRETQVIGLFVGHLGDVVGDRGGLLIVLLLRAVLIAVDVDAVVLVVDVVAIIIVGLFATPGSGEPSGNQAPGCPAIGTRDPQGGPALGGSRDRGPARYVHNRPSY